MCYNCGCKLPNDNMGHKENITEETFEKAAIAMSMTVEETKKNVLELLQEQLKQA